MKQTAFVPFPFNFFRKSENTSHPDSIWGGKNTQPDSDTSGNRCTKPYLEHRYRTRLSAQGNDIKDNFLFHINSVTLFVSPVFMVPEFRKFLPDQQLIGYDSAYPLNKADNIEELIQCASHKPDSHTVLISAYIPNTRHRFSCLFHP